MMIIKHAWRNVLYGKGSTLIKIASLSLGIFVAVVLCARVAYELNYDTCYNGIEQIHVVETSWGKENGMGEPQPYNLYPTARTLMEHFPNEVESASVIFSFVPNKLKHANINFQAHVIAADSLYFQTMGISLLEGNALDLGMPDAIFLSQSLAREIFGSEEPIGKTLLLGDGKELLVKGLFADLPENVSTPVDAVTSINGLNYRMDWYSGGNFLTRARLKKEADVNEVNKRTHAVFANYLPISDYYGQYGIRDINISLAPLKGYHLRHSKVRTMIIVLSLLAFSLLFTAAFNYALIAISSLAHRAKAIGVHKCVGAETGHVLNIFFWETFIIIASSIAIATLMVVNFRHKVEELTDITLEGLFDIHNLWLPLLAIGLLFVIGCFLPGRLFASIPVTQVFHRYVEGKKQWKYPLLFVQFGGASFLLGFVAIIFAQYRYTLCKDLGWSSERIAYAEVSFENPRNGLSNLRNLPYVEGAENAESVIFQAFEPEGIKGADGKMLFYPRTKFADRAFCELLGVRLLEGRFHTNPNELVVNRAFVKSMGWNSNGLGEVVPEMGTVTGIVDYNFPDYVEMKPFCIRWWNNDTSTSCIHLRLKDPFDDNLSRLNQDIKNLYPGRDIVFKSIDDSLNNLFRSARVFRDTALIACIVIFVITLMGVLGHTTEEIHRRRKEISIRKINGAEATNLLQMLCRDVLLIALPAVLLGIFLSVHIGKMWVSNQFRDVYPIHPLLYIAVFAFMIFFILGIVVVKSWKVINENPVQSIKNE